jgi:hypothetical protein
MYTTCLFCNADLGTNDALEPFPVGRRLAFDPARGRLWAICIACHQWNLAPLEERWEAIDECERMFRLTRLRMSTENIGLARLREGLELVRIGRALRPEFAAWRYGDQIAQRQSVFMRGVGGLLRAGARVGNATSDLLRDARNAHGPRDDPLTRLRLYRRRRRVLDITTDAAGQPVILRYGDLVHASLLRPEPDAPWRMLITHQGGVSTLSGPPALRTAGKLFAAINIYGGTPEDVAYASAKVEDAGNESSYFARVFAIAMRTSWGRHPDAPIMTVAVDRPISAAERLALYVSNRSFWGRGGVGSEPATELLALPLVDRLALEMAAHEESERRAMSGELAELEAAWRGAEEIAEIADAMFDDEELETFKREVLERARRDEDPATRLKLG